MVPGGGRSDDGRVPNHEPDVRGRTVVWSAGSLDGPADARRWRRTLGNAGLLGGVALGVSGLLLGVATWSVITPVDAQAPRQLWVNPPRVERGVPVADATTVTAVPVTAPSTTSTADMPSGSATVDDHGGHGQDDVTVTTRTGSGSASPTSGASSDDHGGSDDHSGSDDHGGSGGSGSSGSGSNGSGSNGSGSNGSGSNGSGSSGSGHSGKG